MLLKPLSTNLFFATLLVLTGVLISLALAEPVFGPVLHTEAASQLIRTFLLPLLT